MFKIYFIFFLKSVIKDKLLYQILKIIEKNFLNFLPAIILKDLKRFINV